MGNNTEVVFDNIEQRILKEIEEAHYAIFVSVAWFTNKKLFNALLEKARNNCYVSIIIQLDDINSQCGIDYSQIQVGRSQCRFKSRRLYARVATDESLSVGPCALRPHGQGTF